MRPMNTGATRGATLITALGAALTIAVLVGPASAADAEHGKEVFKACAACHSDKPDAIGPSLRGVFGRNRARSRISATRTP